MPDCFADLLHTDPTCPFCGHIPDGDYLTGVNCRVCQPCRDTIGRWTPSYATLHTADGSFEIWGYIPVAPTWDDVEPRAYFLDPQQTLSELQPETRKTILCYINSEHRELFERVAIEDVKQAQLPKSTQKPIIETVDHVFAKNTDALPQTTSEQSQATFADL
jgi:hypothetical protein